jgi:N-acetylglucosamine-6-sulfatase
VIRGLAAATAVTALTAGLLTGCSGEVATAEQDREARLTSVPVEELAPNDGPNVLVVTMDDVRWDELRFAPHVRRYVTGRGLRFTNSFAPNPLCCPSRASFLIVQYSHNH